MMRRPGSGRLRPEPPAVGSGAPADDLDDVSVQLAAALVSSSVAAGGEDSDRDTGDAAAWWSPRPILAEARALPARTRVAVHDVLTRSVERLLVSPIDAPDVAAVRRQLVEAGVDDDAVERIRRITTLAGSQVLARSVRFLRKIPTGKALVAVTGGVEIAVSIRRGLRELQVIGSHLVLRARAAGIEPDRRRLERATLWAYLLPGTPYQAHGRAGLTRRLVVHWTVRALRPESDRTMRRRAERRADAAATIPVAALG